MSDYSNEQEKRSQVGSGKRNHFICPLLLPHYSLTNNENKLFLSNFIIHGIGKDVGFLLEY